MDLIEILVLITVIALVALLGAVVIVSLQALFNRSPEKQAPEKKPTEPMNWEDNEPHIEMESAPEASSGTAPKVVVDETDLFIDEVMDLESEDDEFADLESEKHSISDADLDAVMSGDAADIAEGVAEEEIEVAVEEDLKMENLADVTVEEPQFEAVSIPERQEPTLNVAEFGSAQEAERMPSYPFMAGRPLLTPIERLFYNDLKATVAQKAEIFPKVRALDVINPKTSLDTDDARRASEQLLNQRFDFVLCDPDDFSVLCIIELEGSDNDDGLQKLQREMLQRSAESAALPVVLVDTRLGYTRKELKERIRYLLPKNAAGFINELLPEQSSKAANGPLQNGYVNGRRAYDTDYEDAAVVGGFQPQSIQQPMVAQYAQGSPQSASLAEREAQQVSAFHSGTGKVSRGNSNTPLGEQTRVFNQAPYQSISPANTQNMYRAPWATNSTRPVTSIAGRMAPASSGQYQNRPIQSQSKPKLRYTDGEKVSTPRGYNQQNPQSSSQHNAQAFSAQKTQHTGTASSSAKSQPQASKSSGEEGAGQGYYSSSGYSADKYKNYRPRANRNTGYSSGYYQNGQQAGYQGVQNGMGGNGYSAQQAREANQQRSNPCPQCGSMMRLSMATRGQYQGQYFWVCSNMPNCSYVGPTVSGR